MIPFHEQIDLIALDQLSSIIIVITFINIIFNNKTDVTSPRTAHRLYLGKITTASFNHPSEYEHFNHE